MSKIYLHVFVPVSSVFILNNMHLVTQETPGYLILNLITFGVVVTLSILSLGKIREKDAKSLPLNSRKPVRVKVFRQGTLRSVYKS